MEEKAIISSVGYDIGKKVKLNEFEILRLFERIRYDQYHDFLQRMQAISSSVNISLPNQLWQCDYEDFESYVHALWVGLEISLTAQRVITL